ncbi:hypothetical protein HDU78_008233, partial [Chytriomyces hyalinus]
GKVKDLWSRPPGTRYFSHGDGKARGSDQRGSTRRDWSFHWRYQVQRHFSAAI